jgi:hypothetical protein
VLFTLVYEFILSLMTQQFVVTHTSAQIEIDTLLNSWVTNTPSVKMVCQKRKASPYIFTKTQRAYVLILLRICQVFSLSCKIVYWWVMKNYCFMSVILFFRVLLLFLYFLSIPNHSLNPTFPLQPNPRFCAFCILVTC